MYETLCFFWRDESGQDLIEYALLVGIVSLGSVAALHAVATAVNNIFLNIAGQLTTAAS
jgi:pilus assembly protein Flp/PilA